MHKLCGFHRGISLGDGTMKAVRFHKFGGSEVLVYEEEVPRPVPARGEMLEKSLLCLAQYGRLVIYGNASGRQASLSASDIYPVSRGVLGFSIGRSPQGVPDHHSAMAEMLPLFQPGKLRLVMDRIMPMGDMAKAHTHLESRGSKGKVILTP